MCGVPVGDDHIADGRLSPILDDARGRNPHLPRCRPAQWLGGQVRARRRLRGRRQRTLRLQRAVRSDRSPESALAEHKVAAFVVNASGVVQAGDTETPVGVGGYYVAIGDSITHGDFDTADTTDNVSADGRDVGGGFEPILNNLLTAELGYPHTVKNEGIGGITSAGGLAALPNVLAAHPQAQRYLVEYGMNDARPSLPVPSGLGLNPGDPGYPGTYKDNLQQIINLIHAAGKEVMIAKVGIALGDGATTTPPYPDPNQGARSLKIQQFNLVVDELVANPANHISIVPPDFYAYFLAHYRTEYYDNIHPNSTGYQSMANLWFQAIVP